MRSNKRHEQQYFRHCNMSKKYVDKQSCKVQYSFRYAKYLQRTLTCRISRQFNRLRVYKLVGSG